jgi:hypothetical protein
MTTNERLRVYDFHGLRLGCAAEAFLTSALDARFGRFSRANPGPCDVRFDFRRVDAAELDRAAIPPEDARVVYESPMGEVFYGERTDTLFIGSRWPIRASCDPRSGETTVSLAGAVDEHAWALAHPMLTIPLIEKLKRRGRYSLHAAGVASGGRAILVPGASGSGKSTLALALARAGFGFLGDDMSFLVRSTEGLRALAFPEAFDVTDDTVRLFPDLADVLASEKKPGFPKRQLRAEDRFGAEIVWQCRPVALVFPRVNGPGPSALSPMDHNEALVEMVPNILLTEPRSSQEHLDVLAALVAQCACYRLSTGTDFEELATQMRVLLEQAP